MRSEQTAVNNQVLLQLQNASARMQELQSRQDHSEASFKERLQTLELTQREGLERLQRMLEDKRPRTA